MRFHPRQKARQGMTGFLLYVLVGVMGFDHDGFFSSKIR